MVERFIAETLKLGDSFTAAIRTAALLPDEQPWPEPEPCVRVADRWSITEEGRAALREAGL